MMPHHRRSPLPRLAHERNSLFKCKKHKPMIPEDQKNITIQRCRTSNLYCIKPLYITLPPRPPPVLCEVLHYLHARPLYSVRQSKMFVPRIPLPAWEEKSILLYYILASLLIIFYFLFFVKVK